MTEAQWRDPHTTINGRNIVDIWRDRLRESYELRSQYSGSDSNGVKANDAIDVAKAFLEYYETARRTGKNNWTQPQTALSFNERWVDDFNYPTVNSFGYKLGKFIGIKDECFQAENGGDRARCIFMGGVMAPARFGRDIIAENLKETSTKAKEVVDKVGEDLSDSINKALKEFLLPLLIAAGILVTVLIIKK
jgi:hypothetical protein